MIFRPLDVSGAYLVDLEKQEDHRGFFARMFCQREFERHGLNPAAVQCNMSFTKLKGVIRGMHFQVTPAEETKLIRCVRGRIHDVILDVRRESRTYKGQVAVELNSENRMAVYVPAGVAHGFQSLTDDVEMIYVVSEFYTPECARGIRFDDPAFDIEWPLPVTEISAADASWPDYEEGPAAAGASPHDH